MPLPERDYVAELQTWVDNEKADNGLISICFDIEASTRTPAPTRPQLQEAARQALAMIAYTRRPAIAG